MAKLFCIIEKSCRMRKDDIKECKDILYAKGWSLTRNHKIADLILFFTCDYAKVKEQQMFSEIANIKKELKPGSEFIIGGCLPKISKESLNEIFKGRTVGLGNYAALNSLSAIKQKDAFSISPIFHRFSGAIGKFINLTFDRYYTICIVRGCLNKCSYCAIRTAINPLKSKPIKEVMEEFQGGLNAGYRKFELIGDSVGDYGLDMGFNLGDLLKELLNIKRIFKISLASLYPSSFLKYFNQIEDLCKLNKIDSVYLPVQSGNERVLKLMNRHYDIEEIKRSVFKIKKYKNVRVKTGIMIGFPTETEEEFQDSLNFIKDIKVNHVAIHLYSDMPDTESSKLSGKINKDTVLKRYGRLRPLCAEYNVRDIKREVAYFRSQN